MSEFSNVSDGARRFHAAPTTVAVLAAGVWLGGLLTLGAIVAPVVFHTIPAPLSADAMTVVFRRFDKVAMACAGIVLAAEAWRVARGETKAGLLGGGARMATYDAARIAIAVFASAMAVWQAMALSPEIERLHLEGAIRGSGPLGVRLGSVGYWLGQMFPAGMRATGLPTKL